MKASWQALCKLPCWCNTFGFFFHIEEFCKADTPKVGRNAKVICSSAQKSFPFLRKAVKKEQDLKDLA